MLQSPSHVLASFPIGPLPISDLCRVYTVLMSVSEIFEYLVLQPILDVSSRFSEFRHPVDYIDRQIESVHLISNAQLEGRIDIPHFLVTAHMQIGVVGTSIC